MITVKRAAKRIEAGLGGNWNARDYAYVENIIRDVVVTKGNEIERLRNEIDAYDLAESERNAGIVGECPECWRARQEIERLKKRISHADDLARDYFAADEIKYGRMMKEIRKALAGGEVEK